MLSKSRLKSWLSRFWLAPCSAVEFVLLVPPQPKGRHRTGRGHTYTPAKTVAYEAAVKAAWLRACPEAPPWDLASWMRADIVFVVARMSQDVDNLAKAVLDALNGAAYKDDSQVIELNVRKEPGSWPGARVRIEPAFRFPPLELAQSA